MREELEADEAAALFKAHCVEHYGSVNSFAKKHNVAPSYVQRMAVGEVPLNDLALEQIGLVKHRIIVHYYTRVE